MRVVHFSVIVDLLFRRTRVAASSALGSCSRERIYRVAGRIVRFTRRIRMEINTGRLYCFQIVVIQAGGVSLIAAIGDPISTTRTELRKQIRASTLLHFRYTTEYSEHK